MASPVEQEPVTPALTGQRRCIDKPKTTLFQDWATILKLHRDVLGAIDSTTVVIWTKSGLVTYYLQFALKLKTRRVHFAGCTRNPHEARLKRMYNRFTKYGFTNYSLPNDTREDQRFEKWLVAYIPNSLDEDKLKSIKHRIVGKG